VLRCVRDRASKRPLRRVRDCVVVEWTDDVRCVWGTRCGERNPMLFIQQSREALSRVCAYCNTQF
jgi:hypothetical protein